MIEKLDINLMRFDRPEDEEKAILDLQAFVSTPGWQFMIKVLQQNIDDKTAELLNNETLDKEQNNNLKRDIRVLDFLKNLPQRQLEALKPTNTADDVDEDDAYEGGKTD